MGFNEMYETWSRESAILKVGLETKVEEIIKGLKEGKLIPSDNVNYVFLLV